MAVELNLSWRHAGHFVLLCALSAALALLLVAYFELSPLTAFGIAVTAVCQANRSILQHVELTQRALDVAEEKARRAADKREALQAGVSAKKRR